MKAKEITLVFLTSSAVVVGTLFLFDRLHPGSDPRNFMANIGFGLRQANYSGNQTLQGVVPPDFDNGIFRANRCGHQYRK